MFWQGAATGLVVSGLNHTFHELVIKKTYTFNRGEKTEFEVTEWGVAVGEEPFSISYSEIQIKSPNDYYFENEEISASGLSYGAGTGVVPVEFGASKGEIVFDKKMSGNSLYDLFSKTKSVIVRSGSLMGFKISLIMGFSDSSSQNQIWNAIGFGGAGQAAGVSQMRGATDWVNK